MSRNRWGPSVKQQKILNFGQGRGRGRPVPAWMSRNSELSAPPPTVHRPPPPLPLPSPPKCDPEVPLADPSNVMAPFPKYVERSTSSTVIREPAGANNALPGGESTSIQISVVNPPPSSKANFETNGMGGRLKSMKAGEQKSPAVQQWTPEATNVVRPPVTTNGTSSKKGKLEEKRKKIPRYRVTLERLIEGIRKSIDDDTTEQPPIYAETVHQHITNHILSLETKSIGMLPKKKLLYNKYDRAGLQVLLFFIRQKHFPETVDAFIQCISQNTHCFRGLPENTSLKSKAHTLLTVFFAPGSYGAADFATKRIKWNVEWLGHLMSYDSRNTPQHEISPNVRVAAMSCVKEFSCCCIFPQSRQEFVNYLNSSWSVPLSQAIDETGGCDKLSEILIDGILLKEEFLKEPFVWNEELIRRLFPKESTTQSFSGDDEQRLSAATSAFIRLCISSGFPQNRLEAKCVLAQTTTLWGLDDLQLLRALVERKCLAVTDNGSFMWNMGLLRTCFPTEHESIGNVGTKSQIERAPLETIVPAEPTRIKSKRKLSDSRIPPKKRSHKRKKPTGNEPLENTEVSESPAELQRADETVESPSEAQTGQESVVAEEPQKDVSVLEALPGSPSAASSEQPNPAGGAATEYLVTQVLPAASQTTESSSSEELLVQKEAMDNPILETQPAKRLATGLPHRGDQPREKFSGEEPPSETTHEAPISATDVSQREMPNELLVRQRLAKAKLKKAMISKKRALAAAMLQSAPPILRPINALLKGGLETLNVTDISRSGPAEKVRFSTRALLPEAEQSSDNESGQEKVVRADPNEMSAASETSHIRDTLEPAEQKKVVMDNSVVNPTQVPIHEHVADNQRSEKREEAQSELRDLLRRKKDAERKRWISHFKHLVSQQELLLNKEEANFAETAEQLDVCERELLQEESKLSGARKQSSTLLTRKGVLDGLLAAKVAELMSKRTELHGNWKEQIPDKPNP